MITADDIAIAIVAACRQTGEDPILAVQGHTLHKKARHYAFHALIHVFPRYNQEVVARCLGSGKTAKQFIAASFVSVLGRGGRTKAGWWDDEAFDRVIRAIEAGKTKRAIAPASPAVPAPRSAARSAPCDPPPGMPPRAVPKPAPADRAPRFARLGSREEVPASTENKSKLNQMLADALAETARQQARQRGEEV